MKSKCFECGRMIANPDQQDDNLCPECRDDSRKIRESHARTFKGGKTMTTKHTPGPWEVINGVIFPVNGERDENERRYAVATTTDEIRPYRGYLQFDNHEQWLANARLIAAAPELAARLDECLSLLTSTSYERDHENHKTICGYDFYESVMQTIDELRALLSRLEGK